MHEMIDPIPLEKKGDDLYPLWVGQVVGVLIDQDVSPSSREPSVTIRSGGVRFSAVNDLAV